MAYATPKENWVSGEIPVASDFNRIEGNTKENHDAIIAEVAARVADVDAEEAARIADVNAEEAARIAADLAINNILSGNIVGSYGYWSVAVESSMVIPKGMYNLVGEYYTDGSGETQLQIYTGSTWEPSISAYKKAYTTGLLISDGVNYRVVNTGSGSAKVFYRKLA